MYARFFTEADQICCLHGRYSIRSSATSTAGGAKVLLESDLYQAPRCTVPRWPGGPPCGGLAFVQQLPLRSTFKSGHPVLSTATIFTDTGFPAIILPRLEPAGPSIRLLVSGGTPGDAATPGEPIKEHPRDTPLTAGVYLAARRIKGSPFGFHQFIVLVPRRRENLPLRFRLECKELGRDTEGLTVAGINTNKRSPLLEMISRQNLLVFESNEESDLLAAQEWVRSNGLRVPEWHTVLHDVSIPAGVGVDEFILRVLTGAQAYETNSEQAKVEYPVAGGPLLRLTAHQCFNSNSWAHGLLEVAQGRFIEPRFTELARGDLCHENRIPTYYFRDNRGRVQRAVQRREQASVAVPFAVPPARRFVDLIRHLVPQVRDDPSIANPVEVILEDLREILFGSHEPELGIEPLNSDLHRWFDRVILSLRANVSGHTNSDPVVAALSGLTWGFYAKMLAPAVASVVLVMEGAIGHPLIFVRSSAVGGRLADDPARLDDLADQMQPILHLAPASG